MKIISLNPSNMIILSVERVESTHGLWMGSRRRRGSEPGSGSVIFPTGQHTVLSLERQGTGAFTFQITAHVSYVIKKRFPTITFHGSLHKHVYICVSAWFYLQA